MQEKEKQIEAIEEKILEEIRKEKEECQKKYHLKRQELKEKEKQVKDQVENMLNIFKKQKIENEGKKKKKKKKNIKKKEALEKMKKVAFNISNRYQWVNDILLKNNFQNILKEF